MKVLLTILVTRFQARSRKLILVPIWDIMAGTKLGGASWLVNSCMEVTEMRLYNSTVNEQQKY